MKHGNSPATSRLLHISMSSAPAKFVAGKRTLMLSRLNIQMKKFIVRWRLSSIEKAKTFHLGKPRSNSKAEFAAICLVCTMTSFVLTITLVRSCCLLSSWSAFRYQVHDFSLSVMQLIQSVEMQVFDNYILVKKCSVWLEIKLYSLLKWVIA